jgi:hypothetical protein
LTELSAVETRRSRETAGTPISAVLDARYDGSNTAVAVNDEALRSPASTHSPRKRNPARALLLPRPSMGRGTPTCPKRRSCGDRAGRCLGSQAGPHVAGIAGVPTAAPGAARPRCAVYSSQAGPAGSRPSRPASRCRRAGEPRHLPALSPPPR